ncbi:hypothetical protein KQX54_011396 [Cotesia glomerata]|uniref:Uncharacterized protein n=1 Tax=Cotesia glomerata TaxID=32391 RepID=A0AAV7I492_COTGL|nr:hypothetical protein KQX54_011396 [Cotesia glomerata]
MKEKEDGAVKADQPMIAKKRARTGKKENANKDYGNSANDIEEDGEVVDSQIKVKQKQNKIYDVLLRKARKQDIAMYKIRQEMKSLNAKVDNLTAVTTKIYETLLESQTSRPTRTTLPQQFSTTSHFNNSAAAFNNGLPQVTHQSNNQVYFNVSSLPHYRSQHIPPLPINPNYNGFNNHF